MKGKSLTGSGGSWSKSERGRGCRNAGLRIQLEQLGEAGSRTQLERRAGVFLCDIVATRGRAIARNRKEGYTGWSRAIRLAGGSILPLSFRLQDYPRYVERVGEATYLDVTRRTDPARIQGVWENLRAVVDTYDAPWVVQIWTKDSEGVLRHGARLLRRLMDAGTTVTAQVTVTGLGGTEWEPTVPSEPFHDLVGLMAAIGGPKHVTWRYDPIIPTVHRLDCFRRLAAQAAGSGITRAVINFIAPPGRYKRVDGRLARALPGWGEGLPWYDQGWRVRAAQEIVAIADEMGIRVACCAESAELSGTVESLHPAACGDYEWFASLSGSDPGRVPSSGSRRNCGCARYFDVGMYGQWRRCHRCLYCYAG